MEDARNIDFYFQFLYGLKIKRTKTTRTVMSMVKMILFSPEKLKLLNNLGAWLLSLIYEGSDLTMGVMTLSK